MSFFSYSILPVLTYALVFLVLVGVEELTRLPVIPEGFARTLLLVVGIGSAEVLLLTVIFAIAAKTLQDRVLYVGKVVTHNKIQDVIII